MDSNLSNYHIFNEVASYKNISLAAKKLYISQPAISKSIKKLENSLETQLFYRLSKGVELTEEGQILYEYTKNAFDSIHRGEEMIKANRKLKIGHIRIGASSSLCKHILLPYLKSFIKEYPHVKFTIESQSSLYTIKLLEDNYLDIGLIAKPVSLNKHLSFISLGEIEDIFVATPAYLNNLKLREGDNDLFNVANIMLLDGENITRKYIDTYLRENQIFPQQVLQVSNMDLLIDFAKTSIGIACVIKEFVQNEINKGELIQIPLENPIQNREIGFAYINTKPLNEAINNFIEYK